MSPGRLVFAGVRKGFGDGAAPAVRDVSLACEPGELVVLVGPSGCGKSTLLALAAGTLVPDEGSVRLDGRSVTGPGPDRAMVFQDHALFPWLNALENVELGLALAGVPSTERRERAAAALAAVRMSDAGTKLIHELSGGMRQRVAIARALVLEPAVLLMDEPFAALDPSTRARLHEHLEAVWSASGPTILFVTHSVDEAVRLADRIVVMASSPGAIRKEIPLEPHHPRAHRARDPHALAELARAVGAELDHDASRPPLAADDARGVVAGGALGGGRRRVGAVVPPR